MDRADDLRRSLPQTARDRLVSLREAGGVVTAVLDVSGLDAAQRSDIEQESRTALLAEPGVQEVRIALTADRKRRRIIAIASGKGGVGKSTVAANLAVALARSGRKVGLVDADIHGPSQAHLLGLEDSKPEARGDKLVPVMSAFGVALLSMGQLIPAGKAIAWRGPMVGNALGQLIDAHWDDIDLLLVDLPPGTGDIHLTMVQRFKPDGAVIVTTPQDLALIDATRAVDLFDQVGIPVIGVVENMAGYVCPHCGGESDPFGRGGAQAAAEQRGLPFLGRIPLSLGLREASDAGHPPAAAEAEGGGTTVFADLSSALRRWLDRS